MTKRIVSLGSLLSESAGQFEHEGTVHRVRPLKGREYRDLDAMKARDNADDVMVLYRMAGACASTLTEDQVLDLTMPQIQMILAIASGSIVEVEETVPKAAEGTAAETRA